MSGSLNKIWLVGNVGRDPEVKTTPNGQKVANFSLATTETSKNPQGERVSKTEWHNIIVWGKQADVAGTYLLKGKQILVEGRIQYREYTDKAGAKKTVCEIRCDNFVMLGKKEEGPGRPEPDVRKEEVRPPDFGEEMELPPSFNDDDIPF